MANLKLKHPVFKEDAGIAFYEGDLPIIKGVVTIPNGKKEWAASAWLRGYRLDAETGQPLTPEEVQERISA